MDTTTALSLQLDAQGLLIATLVPGGHRPPLLDEALLQALALLATRLDTEPAVRGALLCSQGPDFLAGADLELLTHWTTAQQAFDGAQRFKAVLRRLERCGKPVVAALQGRCLGPGLDLALACHHRVLLADGRARLGFPELRWGVLPAGGGTQRLPRLIGLQRALPWLAQDQEADAAQALSAGLVHALAASPQAMLQQAQAWALAHPAAQQPWDEPGFRQPGGDSRSPGAAALFALAPSAARARPGPHLPAETHVLSCLFEGGLLDMDNALTLESRFFAAAVLSPESRQLVQALWRQRRAVRQAAAQAAAPSLGRLGLLGGGPEADDLARRLQAAGLPLRRAPLHEAARLAGCALVLAPGLAARTPAATGMPVLDLAWFEPWAGWPLLELGGADTLPADTLAQALGLALKLGATPLPVRGPAGAFSQSLRQALAAELAALQQQGVAAHQRAQALRLAGLAEPAVGWPEAPPDHALAAPVALPALAERLCQAVGAAALQALSQGLVASAAEASLGAILGAGYPAWRSEALARAVGLTPA